MAGNTFGAAVLIFYEVRGAAIAFGHHPFLFGILQRHFLFEKVVEGHFEAGEEARQIEAFPEI